jgi:hypothetical protein
MQLRASDDEPTDTSGPFQTAGKRRSMQGICARSTLRRLTTPVTDVTNGAACHHQMSADLRHAAI